MSGDPVMDFFDLSKPLKRIVLGPKKKPIILRPETDRPDSEEEAGYDPWNQKKPGDTGTTEKQWKQFQKEKKMEFDQERHLAKTEQEFETSESYIGALAESVASEESHLGARSKTGRTQDTWDLGKEYGLAKPNVAKDRQLPIQECKEEILNVIDNFGITIISGPTGCGKTTQVPQFILDQCASSNKYCNIVVTQPRRLAAMSVAKRVCNERNWELGTIVGYKVGLDKENVSRDTRLLYCTTGVLKKMVINKKAINEFTHVILDEVHEREEDMDFLLLLCKKFLATNSRRVKLILMSATIKVEQFKQYFAYKFREIRITPGVFDIPNISDLEVKLFYWDNLKKYFPPEAKPPELNDGPKLFQFNVELCKNIILKLDAFEEQDVSRARKDIKGTVLVFLPGEREIMDVKRVLMDERYSEKHHSEWDVIVLHSRIPVEDSQAVFKQPSFNKRKVILSTNIAESSITIPDVEYVIDFCLTKNLMADPDTNFVTLKLQWADHHSCDQRKGRAGRVQNGRAFRLISKSFFQELPNEHLPEMQRAPLDKIILDTKLLDCGSPKELLALAMSPPDMSNIKKTILNLKQIGALLTTVHGIPKEDDGDMTVLGEIVARLPMDIKLGKLIVLGHLFRILDEVVLIAAGLCNKSIFATPVDKKAEAYASKLIWADRTFSDCIAIYHALTTFKKLKRQGYFEAKEINGAKQYCHSRYLQLKVIEDVEVTTEEIFMALKRMGIENHPMPNRQPLTEDEIIRNIQICLFGAFYPNYFVRNSSTYDKRQVAKDLNFKDPMTSVFLTGFPKEQSRFAEVYSSDIKKLFKMCASEDKIDVQIEDSRIVVQFSRTSKQLKQDFNNFSVKDVNTNENLTGEIAHQVYLALKLRYGPYLHLDLFRPEKAEEIYRKGTKTPVAFGNDYLTTSELQLIKTPSPSVSSCKVDVVHANHPNSFWVQYATREKDQAMSAIENAIDNIKESLKSFKIISDVMENKSAVVLAPFADESGVDFYRAKIDRIDGTGEVVVFFLDYGNSAHVKITDLKPIPRKVVERFEGKINLPAQAMECSLYNVRPNPMRNARGVWDDAIISKFKDDLHMERVTIYIHGVVCQSQFPFLHVILELDDKTIYNDKLKANNANKMEPSFAVEAPDDWLANENHRIRQIYKNIDHEPSGEELNKLGSKALNFDASRIGSARDLDDRVHRVQLRGPFHPLEMKVSGLSEAIRNNQVRIGHESVNAVLLDRFPLDNHDQWLVAAHVGMIPNGQNVLLRGTSMMPQKPGLGSLLIMIFAPFVELRANKSLTRYTGFLSGLGSRPATWGQSINSVKSKKDLVPYYSEMDMEIQFDTSVTNMDIELINNIRSCFNFGLTRDSGVTRGDGTSLSSAAQMRECPIRISTRDNLKKVQDEIAISLNKLLKPKRLSRPRESWITAGKWNKMPPREYLLDTGPDADHHWLKMITGFKMDSKQMKETQKKLQELVKLIDLAEKSLVNLSESCPVCDDQTKVFTSSQEIEKHLLTKRHQDNVDRM